MAMYAATARIASKTFTAPLQRAAFSTTPSRTAVGPAPGKKHNASNNNNNNNNNNNKSGESPIEVPVFDLRHITSSPRVRFLLIAGFCVVGSVEMYGWYNFGPKILGWEEAGKGGENV